MEDEEMEDRFFKSMGTNRETIERQARVIARPYVEEEREACARMVDDLAKAVGEYVGPQTDHRVVREVEVKTALLRDVAELIRRRT